VLTGLFSKVCDGFYMSFWEVVSLKTQHRMQKFAKNQLDFGSDSKIGLLHLFLIFLPSSVVVNTRSCVSKSVVT